MSELERFCLRRQIALREDNHTGKRRQLRGKKLELAMNRLELLERERAQIGSVQVDASASIERRGDIDELRNRRRALDVLQKLKAEALSEMRAGNETRNVCDDVPLPIVERNNPQIRLER